MWLIPFMLSQGCREQRKRRCLIGLDIAYLLKLSRRWLKFSIANQTPFLPSQYQRIREMGNFNVND